MAAWRRGNNGRLTRRLNSANHPSRFGQRLRMPYPAMLHRGAPMTISILNDLLLFSCLVALATRLL